MAWNPFSKWFRGEEKPDVADIAIGAKQINVNPGRPEQLARHIGRLANLYNVHSKGDTRQAVADEIKQRKSAIQAFNQPAPQNEKEAREMFLKLGAM